MDIEYDYFEYKDEAYKINLEVEEQFIPAVRGDRDSFNGVRGAGPPLEPDEPAHWEYEINERESEVYMILADEDRLLTDKKHILEILNALEKAYEQDIILSIKQHYE